MRVKVDLNQFKALARDLEKFSKNGMGHASRNTLNKAAFNARTAQLAEVRKSLTLRSTFTTRSIQVQKAVGTDVKMMMAVVGSVAPYMADVEQGEKQHTKGKHGVPIPMPGAAGQAPGSKRTKRIRRQNYRGNFELSASKPRNPSSAKASAQRNAMAIRQAAKAGGRMAFLDLGRSRGLYRVSGGKKTVRVKLIYDLSHKTVESKPIPTLQRAVDQIAPTIGSIAIDEMTAQLRRYVRRSGG